MLENVIAYHCGPALAGIKPANIANINKSKIKNIHSEIGKLNRQLNCRDIYLKIICECEERALVMVYRRKALTEHLKKADNHRFLLEFGYPENGGVSDYISFLENRFKKYGCPDEIGVFLGYPLYDIYGFMYHKNQGCILVGEWRVYHNAEKAEKLFVRYRACRRALVKRVADGRTLAQIFCAA